MMETRRGSGIGKIPLKGAIGLIFAVGVMALILVAVPAARWFFLFSLPAGVFAGVILYLWHARSR